MTPWHSANLGDAISSIDTPSLILDLDAFERNIELMASALKEKGIRLRAHAKSHKCPEIAKIQIAKGAVGICCQKVSEAAVFVEAGIQDVLVTNQIVSPTKVKRLFELARSARMGILVDHPKQVAVLLAEARLTGLEIDVYVEVNVGSNRCGVSPGKDAVALARLISESAPLRFAGLHCYQGSAQHFRLPAERKTAIQEASKLAKDLRDALLAEGLACPRVTGAGTGTFLNECDSGIFDEVQAGSYIFMDRDYSENQLETNDLHFEHALFIQATVMSYPEPHRAVLDAGLKAFSVDSGMPAVWKRPDLKLTKASDEHGVLEVSDPSRITLGDRLTLIPGHCDPTVNLYDALVCIRNNHVEAIWPISARGALL